MHVATVPTRARTRARKLTARQEASTGQIRLESANVDPGQVSPNGEIEVTLHLREDAEFVSPADSALCNPPGALATTGLRTAVTIAPDWTSEITDEVCVPVWTTSSGESEVSYSLIAPNLSGDATEEGHSITITVEQVGRPSDSTTKNLTVQEDGFVEPVDGGNGGGDGGFPSAILATVFENPLGAAGAVIALSLALRVLDIFGD